MNDPTPDPLAVLTELAEIERLRQEHLDSLRAMHSCKRDKLAIHMPAVLKTGEALESAVCVTDFAALREQVSASARQAAWLRLVAWGLMHEVLTVASPSPPSQVAFLAWIDDWQVAGARPFFCDADADGMPIFNQHLEAALTVVMESARSEA